MPDDLYEPETDTRDKKPWVMNGPEARLSIAVDRFLRRALVPPFYCTAIHDSDGGKRSMTERVRDKNRGVQKGQLDWHVAQPGIWRALELKRGRNTTSEAQDQTIASLTACGFRPVVAWTLREVAVGLREEGFKFLPNAGTTLQHMEAQLEAWDRNANDIKTGVVIKKKSRPRKAGPRYTASAGFVARARAKGIIA